MKKTLLCCLLTLPLLSNAAWKVNKDDSTIHFMSTKKEHIVEIHSFDNFAGKVSDSGTAMLKIDLASVNTMIPIRDERMQKFLFETTKFSQATLSAKLDSAAIKQLKAGQSSKQSVAAELDLHGKKQALTIDLKITATENGFNVHNIKPVLVDSRQYDLTAGVDKLKQLAGLPSIGYVVPVNFSLNLVEK